MFYGIRTVTYGSRTVAVLCGTVAYRGTLSRSQRVGMAQRITRDDLGGRCVHPLSSTPGMSPPAWRGGCRNYGALPPHVVRSGSSAAAADLTPPTPRRQVRCRA